jgi:hypothetical protein
MRYIERFYPNAWMRFCDRDRASLSRVFSNSTDILQSSKKRTKNGKSTTQSLFYEQQLPRNT